MASSFTLVTHTRVPVEELFDVSLSIDAHMASMARSREKPIAGVTAGSIGLGETVTWRARHFGIWFTMTSKITTLDRPHRFVDEQVDGPFRSFRHVQTFRRREGITVMTDTLTISSPILGHWAEQIVLAPYLHRLIRWRNHFLLASLGAAPGTDPQLPVWPVDESSPFRRFEASTLVGRGDEVWERACHDLLRWKVKTRSGFTVGDARPVSPGTELTITAHFLGVTIREPVQVATVTETRSRVGFSYRTRPGHPVSGEEAFVVHRDGDDVILTIRSLTAPAPHQPWRALYPILLLVQRVARRRYLRALRP